MCLLDMDCENDCERGVFILLASLAKGNFLCNCQTYIKFKKTEMSCAYFWVDLTNNIKNAVNARKSLIQEKKK